MSVRFSMPGSAARSAVIAISRPSGAMSKSLVDGSHGGSASPVPASASRQRPVATSQTNTCGSRPSVSQWSQKRTSARSVACTLTFASLRSLLRFACAASVARSRHTHETNATRLPSANQRTDAQPVDERRHAARLAAVGRDHVELRRLVVRALRGERDQAAVGRPRRAAVLVPGGEAPRPRAASRPRRVEPQLGRALVLLDVVARDRARRPALPSGASVGVPMRFSAHRASTVSGGRRAGMGAVLAVTIERRILAPARAFAAATTRSSTSENSR